MRTLMWMVLFSVCMSYSWSLAMNQSELEARKAQVEAQFKVAVEAYMKAKKNYEESLRSKDSVELRRSQYFDAKNRVKLLYSELRALGIRSDYVLLEDKINKLKNALSDSENVPRGTDR